MEMPPSAMTGMPNCAAKRATLYTADACGRPTAHTSCVVLFGQDCVSSEHCCVFVFADQIEPTPMPTRSPCAPASIKCIACLAAVFKVQVSNEAAAGERAAEPVTILPAITSRRGYVCRTYFTYKSAFSDSARVMERSANHVDLIDGVALRRVDHNNIHAWGKRG